eukprot:2913731-Pleurochrysis_carterae.AAC.1
MQVATVDGARRRSGGRSQSSLGGNSSRSIGVMRSAHGARSGADAEVSVRRACLSAAAAEAAVWSAAAAGVAAESARCSLEERAAAGIAPKEKALASAGDEKSASVSVGRTSACTLTAARVARVEVVVPAREASVHHMNAAALRSALRRCVGVRATSAPLTATGTGATASRGPSANSRARKHARHVIALRA